MIITIGGTKGGGGKTTIATNLAVMRARAGRDVLLIDADPQGTASTFSVLRRTNDNDLPGYTSVRLLGEEILNSYMNLKSKYQDIVIDAGGRETDSHRAALGIADIALIPFQPSSFDIWELGKASIVVKEMRTMNRNLKAYTLINQAEARGTDNEAAAEFAGEVEGLLFYPHPVVMRKAFKRAAASGLSVVEVKPPDQKAIEEMQALYDFAFNTGAESELKLAGNQ
jgi:chromosome partitioning protein